MEPMSKSLKVFIAFSSLVAVGLVLFFAFSVKVRPAEVAISVDLYGNNKGVELEVLPTGRNFYNSISHDVIKYPAYIQQGIYEDITFQDIDGLALAASVAIDYKFVAENIPALYQEYRKSADYITSVYFGTWIKNAMIKQASAMQVDEIYGAKKEEFRNLVLAQLKEEFEPKGIFIDNLYFTNGIGIPEAVKARIDSKIEATQIAQQKQNELAAVEADAKKRIVEAQSIADANTILANSLTEAVLRNKQLELQKEAIPRWNGSVPMVIGSSNGLILDLANLTPQL